MRVYLADIRTYGFCVSGLVEFCKRYDLDFWDFVKNGIDEADLLATGDLIAIEMITRKRAHLGDVDGQQ